MAESLVSIVLTSYNQPHLLKRAFDSLLNQTYKNIEIVIVDDCSADAGNKKLIEQLKQYYPQKIKTYFQEKNVGIPKNKNTGFRLASGKYITYLDGDDTYYEDKIASEVNLLLQNPDVSVVYSNFDIKDVNEKILRVWATDFSPATGYIFKDVLLNNFPDCHTHRCEMFRRNVLYDLDFYDESFSVYEDLDFMLRYSLKYKVAYNDYIGSSYHNNPKSIVTNTTGLALLEQQEAVYKKYIAEINKQGLTKEFTNHINELKLNKLFYLDKLHVGLLLKAFIKHPTRFFKIAKIANYLIKKPKTQSLSPA